MEDVFTVIPSENWHNQCEEIDKAQKENDVENNVKIEGTESQKFEYSEYIENAENLMAKKFPEAKWVVPNLLSEGATIFAGAPKQGKSWMALNIAIAVATGSVALGKIQVEKGDVLYLALEDGEKRMQKRLKGLLIDKEIPKNLNLAFNFPLSNEGGLQIIENWIKNNLNARLIVVDTLKRFRPLERYKQNVYNADYDAVSGLNDLGQKYGVGILVVTHTNKQDADDIDWFYKVSGSLGLTGAVDAAMLLERPRNQKQGKLSVSGRDMEEKELSVQFDGSTNGWTLLGEAFSAMANKVRSWLGQAGISGLNRSEMNRQNGNRTDGIDDVLRELQIAKLVEMRKVETASKPQERWFLSDAALA